MPETKITPEMLREGQILDRFNAITPGDWTACVWDLMERPHVTAGTPPNGHCSGQYDLPRSRADAGFIAAAPADVGYLLAQVGRLRSRLTQAQEALEQLLDDSPNWMTDAAFTDMIHRQRDRAREALAALKGEENA